MARWLVAGALALALCSAAASAHDMYSPLKVPGSEASCCNGQDCALYEGGATAENGGWRIHETGELIPYSQTIMSWDGRFHRCVQMPAWGTSEIGGRRIKPGDTRCWIAPGGDA